MLNNAEMEMFKGRFTEEITEEKESIAYASRLTDEQMTEFEDETDLDELRCRLSEYYAMYFDNSPRILEAKTGIRGNTFQKAINFSSRKNISKETLSAFCVGAGLSADEAKKLFILSGKPLSMEHGYDKLLIFELENHRDIDTYDEDLRQLGQKGIFKAMD